MEPAALRIFIGLTVGTLIGMTGLGGGVLLLPILIFGLGVPAIKAVGSDALFNFITKIVYLTPRSSTGQVTGQFYVLYLIAVTKFSDMGAYLTGSAVGQHLMVPHISAKKTWEGFFGAIVLALLCSLGLFKLMPGHLSVLNWTHATILGVLLGFAAVLGDLAESIIKRSTDVKDSGNLLPGIGGALDLLDSLLFTAPLLFFYLRLVIHVA